MLRHIVLITCTDESSDSQREALVDGLRALPAQIPQIVTYTVGVDAGLPTPRRNADIAVVAEFESADAFFAYRDHPAHQAGPRPPRTDHRLQSRPPTLPPVTNFGSL